jgi:2-methylisocitrate lyase-like PEP mutase family enzyme
MKTNTSAPAQLRKLLKSGKMLIAPGGYDGLTATMIERAGFEAAYMTGAGTAARLGLPDYGLLSMTEMVDNARSMVESVNIPVIADADTGYGNELNTIRTVNAYERAGVAGIHIEDQVFPKRCGHLDGKEVIPVEQFQRKIRAATEQRLDPDFVIIARTDSRTVLGFNAAIERCNAALEAGADAAFFESPLSVEEVSMIPKKVKGPCLFNVVDGGKTPPVTLKQAEEFGFAVSIVPALTFMAVMRTVENVLGRLKQSGEYTTPSGTMTVIEAFQKVGALRWDERRKEYAD